MYIYIGSPLPLPPFVLGRFDHPRIYFETGRGGRLRFCPRTLQCVIVSPPPLYVFSFAISSCLTYSPPLLYY